MTDNAVFGGQFPAYLRLYFVAVSHQIAIVFQHTFIPGCICVGKEGGEGVVSRGKPRSMSHGCGTVVLCCTALPVAERYTYQLGV